MSHEFSLVPAESVFMLKEEMRRHADRLSPRCFLYAFAGMWPNACAAKSGGILKRGRLIARGTG